jgi:hypothetical protein
MVRAAAAARVIHGQQSRRSHKDEIASAQLYGQKVTRNSVYTFPPRNLLPAVRWDALFSHTEKEHYFMILLHLVGALNCFALVR